MKNYKGNSIFFATAGAFDCKDNSRGLFAPLLSLSGSNIGLSTNIAVLGTKTRKKTGILLFSAAESAKVQKYPTFKFRFTELVAGGVLLAV